MNVNIYIGKPCDFRLGLVQSYSSFIQTATITSYKTLPLVAQGAKTEYRIVRELRMANHTSILQPRRKVPSIHLSLLRSPTENVEVSIYTYISCKQTWTSSSSLPSYGNASDENVCYPIASIFSLLIFQETNCEH